MSDIPFVEVDFNVDDDWIRNLPDQDHPTDAQLFASMEKTEKGGAGSGNFGHSGRPGKVGGSATGMADFSISPKIYDFKRRIQEIFAGKDTLDHVAANQYLDDLPIDFHLDAHLEEGLSYAGSRPGLNSNWAGQSDEKRGKIKAGIVDDLNKAIGGKLGITTKMIDDTLFSWASSANDNSIRSLSLQQAAAEEFGYELSDWQKNNFKRAEFSQKAYQIIKENFGFKQSGEIDTERIKNLWGERKNKFLEDVEAKEGSEMRSKVSWMLDDVASTPMTTREINTPVGSREQERTILRAIYENTQKKLAYGSRYVTLYRGIGKRDEISSKDMGKTIRYKGNTMESWSVHPRIAFGFGAVIGIRVPKSRILSTARTGLGCLIEGEVVVMGNTNTKATVVYAS